MHNPATLAAPATTPSCRAHWRAWWLFLALAILLFLPAWTHPTTTVIGATAADASLHAWFFEWTPWAMTHHANPLFTTLVNAPVGANLMWNTLMPLPGIMLAPVTLIAGPVVAFNAAITLGVALSAWSAYWAARRCVRGVLPAVVAGAAYGFSPYLMGHSYVGHSNLALAFVPPLLLAFAYDLVAGWGSPRRIGLLLGALLAVQFFVTEEVAASAVVVGGLGLVVLAIQQRRLVVGHWRRLAAAGAWAAGLFVALTAFPLWYQFFGPGHLHGLIHATNVYVTDLANIALPTDAQGLEPRWAQTLAQGYAGNAGEWGGYIGLPMAIVLGTLWRQARRRGVVRWLLALTVAVIVLSMGSSLHVAGWDTGVPLPGLVLADLPVLNNLLPARLAVYAALSTALLLGIFLDDCGRDRRGRQKAVLASAAVLLSFLPPLPFPTTPTTTPAFFTTPSAARGGRILVAPFSAAWSSPDAMLWQARSGMAFSMPEGYIIDGLSDGQAAYGPAPSLTSSDLLAMAATGQPTPVTVSTRQRVLSELHRWGVSEVVLGPMARGEEATRAFFSALLGAPRNTGGVALWEVPPASP